MKPFFLNWDYRDLRRLVFATLATLLCVMYMLGTPPSPRLSASAIPQSVATYGVQGIIPWYLDSAGKSRLDTTAKLGANQYYLYPYGAMYHKGFLYSQLQATEYTGKTLDEGTQWYYFHARHYDSAYGRFIGHDLVAPDLNNPLTLNPFLYCLNNPGRWVDPDGRSPIHFALYMSALGNAPDTTTDLMMLSISMQAFSQKPGIGTGVAVALDGIALGAPGVNSAMVHGAGKATGKAFDVADTFVGGKFRDVTLKAGTVLERAYEVGKNSALGQFMTRGRTTQAITSTEMAINILALKGTSNLRPNKMAQLELLQDIPAKIGFIEGSSMKNGFQIYLDKEFTTPGFWDLKNILDLE